MLERSLVQDHLSQILSSPAFSSAEALRRLLTYAVGKALEGDTGSLKDASIAAALYPDREDSLVRVQMGNLRKRLAAYYAGPGSAARVRIEIPKGCYVPQFIQQTAPPVFRWRRWALAAALLLVLLAATAAVLRPRHRTVAVLPFLSDSNPEAVLFADGLTEDLIQKLARVEGLRVVARTSAFRFQGKPVDLRAAGRALQVGHVIEGAIRREGNIVVVTARLIDVATGYQTWSGSFERSFEQTLTAQRQLAASIAAALRVEGSPLAAPSVERARSSEAFLKARHYWNKATADGLNKSVTLFEQAIGEEPESARGWAGLADAWNLIANLRYHEPRAAYRKALHAARRALDLDPQLPEAHRALAYNLMYAEWRPDLAQAEFRKALEFAPSDALAYHWYGECLALLGRYPAAVRASREAKRLDPLSPIITAGLGLNLFYQGEFAKAEAELKAALELDERHPVSHLWLARVYYFSNRWEDGMRHARRSVELSGRRPSNVGRMALLEAQAGHWEQAEALRRELEQRWPDAPLMQALVEEATGHRQSSQARLSALRAVPAFDYWRNVWPELGRVRKNDRKRWVAGFTG